MVDRKRGLPGDHAINHGTNEGVANSSRRSWGRLSAGRHSRTSTDQAVQLQNLTQRPARPLFPKLSVRSTPLKPREPRDTRFFERLQDRQQRR